MSGSGTERFRPGLGGRLGRRLLIWFLLLALLPLLLVSLISLSSARSTLHQSAIQTMTSQTRLEAHVIRAFVDKTVDRLLAESQEPRNLAMLAAMREQLANSGKPLRDYVGSYDWALLVDRHAGPLQDLRLFEGYLDVYLLDADGNLLYSLAGHDDLGSNLLTGPWRSSGFARAVRRTLDSGRPTFSDLERYGPANNQVSGFMAAPMIDEAGERIGAIALQIDTPLLLRPFDRSRGEHANRSRLYLIGADLGLRSPGPAMLADFLGHVVDTELTRLWQGESAKPRRPGRSEADSNQRLTRIYADVTGRQVIGTLYPLDMLDHPWAIVAEMDTATAFADANRLFYQVGSLLLFTALVVALIALPITRNIMTPIHALSDAVARVREGQLDTTITRVGNDELGLLSEGFNDMLDELRQADHNDRAQQWLQQGIAGVNDTLRGDKDLPDLARAAIGFLCHYLDAEVGALYLVQNERVRLLAGHALDPGQAFHADFALGEGIVGQVVECGRPRVLQPVPPDYLRIRSGLGETPPGCISVVPLSWNNRVRGALEFATLQALDPLRQRLIDEVAPRIVATLLSTLARDETRRLLQQTQVQAEELQAREEELRNSNQLLEQQAEDLRRNESQLRASQVELEEKNQQLQVQQEELRLANEELAHRADELETARQLIEQRAEELSQSSRYKSEFLANMSHELRTPLNSLLILARLLADNKEGHLDAKQVQYANTIHDSGRDLLNLINDILDLSKIEAGKMELHEDRVKRNDVVAEIERGFAPMASSKGIALRVEAEQAPPHWYCDGQKLAQILRNLLSNAIKFTERGEVRLTIAPAPAPDGNRPRLAFRVRDTGIGIAKDQHATIFEAFKQADGSTSRRFGGTGLGLSICRELARLMGGEIQLDSQPGQGSEFCLLLPLQAEPGTLAEPEPAPKVDGHSRNAVSTPATLAQTPPVELPDDRHDLAEQDRSILIIEDDPAFARTVADIARQRGFKILLANDGETGLHLADYYRPSGIILDIGLPHINGWQVIEQLKANQQTRHIPVHFISAENGSVGALQRGAVGFLTKPVELDQVNDALCRIERVIDHPVKQLLIVEDDDAQRRTMLALIGQAEDLEVCEARSGEAAQRLLQERAFDCMVLDLGLPDMNGLDLLEWLRTRPDLRQLPVVIYTGRELEPKERHQLNQYAQSIIIKDARSPERLLDDTSLFLHRVASRLPQRQRQMLRLLHDDAALFANRKVLLVDDDMRNVFALSAALQERAMQVLTATNGREALEQLDAHPDTAIVLMDIMMPEMDGYEAMRRIRQMQRFQQLPIIALTAKAMKGDRATCIEAGASDYLAKPVEINKLVSMLRVWLYQ